MKKRILSLLLALVLLLSACSAGSGPAISEAMEEYQAQKEAEQPAEEPEAEPEPPEEEIPEEAPAEPTTPEEQPEAAPEETETEPEEESAEEAVTNRENIIPFADMAYTRPELAEMEAAAALVTSLAAEESNGDDVIEALAECDRLYYNAYTMYALAEIRYYLNMTDDYWSEEFTACEEITLEIDVIVEEMYVELANSPCAQRVEDDYYGEGFVEAYTEDYIGYADETFAELSRAENELMAQFREIQSDPTVVYNGEEFSYYEIMSDPNVSYFKLLTIQDLYYDKYAEIYGELFLALVSVRNELARYCGYENYEEYAYVEVYDRDYTPDEIDTLLSDIRTYITPLYVELMYSGAWGSYNSFEVSEEEMAGTLGRVAEILGGEIQETWEFLDAYDLYDISVSPNKSPMSFMTYLEDYEAPFAFIKNDGSGEDLMTFFHEFGHCVDGYANFNATYSLDLAETFSQGMEYLALFYLEGEIDEEKRQDLITMKLLDTLDTYAQQGSFADFEHQVYALSEEEFSIERLQEISLQTAKDYGYFVDGYEDYFSRSWIDIFHFFEAPCYVISYCMSNDSAFQIYQRELEEAGAGLALYRQILPREYDYFLETLEVQGGMESPLAEGRMESTASVIGQALQN